MKKIQFVFKLPFLLVAQIAFIAASPLFFILTAFPTMPLYYNTYDGGPKSVREWMYRFISVTFLPLEMLFS